MERARSKPCQRLPNEGSPPPHNLRRAVSYGLHNGVFKKSTTPECRHHPILGSWVFTWSTKGGTEKPQRRLQEGNDICGRRRRGPGRSRARVSSRHHLSATQTWRGTPPRWQPQRPHKAQLARHHENPMSMTPASTRTMGWPTNPQGSHHPGPPPRRPRSCSRSAKGTTLAELTTHPKKAEARRQQEDGTPTDTTLCAADRRASRSP
jgi:hypothetical protein